MRNCQKVVESNQSFVFIWKNVNKQLKSADFLSEMSKFQKSLLKKILSFLILMSKHTLDFVIFQLEFSWNLLIPLGICSRPQFDNWFESHVNDLKSQKVVRCCPKGLNFIMWQPQPPVRSFRGLFRGRFNYPWLPFVSRKYRVARENLYTFSKITAILAVWTLQWHVIRGSNENFVGFPGIFSKIVKNVPMKQY